MVAENRAWCRQGRRVERPWRAHVAGVWVPLVVTEAGAIVARTQDERLLGHVQHPERYHEVLVPSGGASMALSVWTPSRVERVVVFVPGTAVHPLFYEELLDGLCSAGTAVVGVHPRGHGKSPRSRGVLRWRHLLRNVVDACGWAADRWDAPVVLVGSSQGSLLAVLGAASGTPVRGVIAHNLFDPTTAEAVLLTRLGSARSVVRHAQRGRSLLRAAAQVAPALPVPVTAYLDPSRVFRTAWTQELFELDPLARRTYPLRFLADLVSVDTRPLYDGSVRVPVIVLTARGDPLFPLAGIRAVASRLQAPSVDVIVLDSDCHLVFNEALDLALPAVLDALDRVTAAPVDAGSGDS